MLYRAPEPASSRLICNHRVHALAIPTSQMFHGPTLHLLLSFVAEYGPDAALKHDTFPRFTAVMHLDRFQ